MAQRTAQVVHIVQRMAPGGIETLVLDLIGRTGLGGAIFSLEGTIGVLISGWPQLESYRQRLTTFDRKPGLRPALCLQVARHLRTLSPTVVVTHHLGPLVYGGLAARLAGVPCLVHVEHDIWHYENPRARLLAKLVAKLARPHHVAVSQSVANGMKRIFKSADVMVVPPAIDTNRFLPGDRNRARQRLGFQANWKVIGTVGRIVPIKGHAILIQALATLPPDTHLAIVGEGSEVENLKAIATNIDVGTRLHFLGHRDDVEHIFPAFDVFCLPSLAEGLPRTVLEAQSCGLPVVASDVGGLSEAIYARTGKLVPPADPIALAKALHQVLNQPFETRSTREFIEREFSWSRTLGAYDGFLEPYKC